MKVNVNAFIAVILCTVLLEGLWLLSSRDLSDSNIWNPNQMYQSVGGSSYTSSATSSSSSSSSGVEVVLSPSRRLGTGASFSYAPAYIPYDGFQSPLTQSSYASGVSPISYTASSAQYRSFGGGSAVAGGSSYGAMRSAASQPSAAASLSMPSMPNYAMASRQAAPLENAADVIAINDISSAAAAAAYRPAASTYNGLGYTTIDYGYGSSLGSSFGSFRGISAKKRIGIEDTYYGWLRSEEKWKEALGDDYYYYKDGATDLTKEQIMALYAAVTGDTDFSNEEQWEAFWTWLQWNQTDEFQWKLLPVGDAIPFLLILCLMYVAVRYRKAKKQIV